jgi:hypothetical protein
VIWISLFALMSAVLFAAALVVKTGVGPSCRNRQYPGAPPYGYDPFDFHADS